MMGQPENRESSGAQFNGSEELAPIAEGGNEPGKDPRHHGAEKRFASAIQTLTELRPDEVGRLSSWI
jgi:hypothetical protein